jgi:hypothetical protein
MWTLNPASIPLTLAALLCAAGVTAAETGAEAAAPAGGLKPFAATYQVQWHGINVGTSTLELKPPAAGGEYEYVSRSNARGIFHIVFSDEITQISHFELREGHAQPLKFRGDDGSSATDKDVSLDFDWTRGRVKGVSEDKPVDLALKPDTQDPMSVQIELMLALARQQVPTQVWLADKDEIKEFVYTNEGNRRVKTALGELDTVVLASQRPGGNRITRMWFAPSLGYVPVQAQRTRDGKVEFTMNVKALKR